MCMTRLKIFPGQSPMLAVSGKVQLMASRGVEVRPEQGEGVQMGHLETLGGANINSRMLETPGATDIKVTRLAHQRIPQRTSKLGKTETVLHQRCLPRRGPSCHSPGCSISQGVPQTPLCMIRSSHFWSQPSLLPIKSSTPSTIVDIFRHYHLHHYRCTYLQQLWPYPLTTTHRYSYLPIRDF